MKLRNKKTGESGELHYYPDKDYHFAVETKDPTHMGIYKTLGKLLQDWTDFIVHVPTEPRIMDEKSRNTIREWAEINGFDKVTYEYNVRFGISSLSVGHVAICFFDCFALLENGKEYAITELCGEEGECES